MLVLSTAAPDAMCCCIAWLLDSRREQQTRIVECIMCAVRRIVGHTLLSLLTTDDRASSPSLMNLQRAAAAAITFGQAFPKDILGLSRRPDQASARIFNRLVIQTLGMMVLDRRPQQIKKRTAQLHKCSWRLQPSGPVFKPEFSLPVL